MFFERFIPGGSSRYSALQDAVARKDVVIFCLDQPEYSKNWAKFARRG